MISLYTGLGTVFDIHLMIIVLKGVLVRTLYQDDVVAFCVRLCIGIESWSFGGVS